ncbi:NADPH-dependent FMN reductase [Sinorhizobium fredii]|uniref:NADPH-dependent FMN reductase n=1 Tax=Rhizobium fredii TaxID=380 RepID=UPI003517EA9A
MFGEPTEKNSDAPLIVGLGGTTREGSSTELALRYALKEAEQAGARTMLFNGEALMMPMFAPEVPHRTAEAQAFIAALRAADGIIIASPAYHGSISGLVKNALDYTEDMRNDAAAYLDGRAVGCITCAYGPQAAGTTLVALRSIVHALRGWADPARRRHQQRDLPLLAGRRAERNGHRRSVEDHGHAGRQRRLCHAGRACCSQEAGPPRRGRMKLCSAAAAHSQSRAILPPSLSRRQPWACAFPMKVRNTVKRATGCCSAKLH